MTKNTEVSAPKKKTAIEMIDKIMDSKAEAIEGALGSGVTLAEFRSVCAEALLRDPKLSSAIEKNPAAVFQAFLACARCGLVPDGREAHIDARNDRRWGMTAAFMPMRRGLVKMLYQSGKVKSVNLQVVREGDEFIPNLTTDEKIHHIPMSGNGALTHAYAEVELIGGGIVRRVMFKDEIEQRKRVSKTDNVWRQWPAEMWKKTVLHNIAKDLPLTRAVQDAFDHLDRFADLNAEYAVRPALPEKLDADGYEPPQHRQAS